MDIFKELKKGLVYKKLLDYGMFSEKLTDIFTSEEFGKWVRKKPINTYKNREFSTVTFHLTRNNNAPRIIEIPHPIGYYRLCNEIKKNWSEIIKRIGEIDDYVDRSMVIPKPNNLNKRLVSMLSYNKNKDEKFLHLDKSFQAKYFVHADVANCYPSIYSHSIPWALVGNKEAKDNMNVKTIWYNKLDYAIRSMQRNETVGIAIGPDTSSIISELVLTRIDKELSEYKYLRFIDDYKCYCSSKEHAETFIRELSKELEKYHLRLNPKKTKIIELPKPLDEDWVRELKAYTNKFLNLNKLSKKHINTISEFIDLAINLAQKNPGDSPIRYAVKVLSKKNYLDNDVFAFVIMYLSRVCFIYPYFIDVFDLILQKSKSNKHIIDLVSKEINSLLNEHLKYSRSDVALWGLVLSMRYNFEINDFEEYSDYLIEDRDCLPTLLCYEYSKNKKLDTKKYFELVKELVNGKDEEEWWIYIYSLYYDSPRKAIFKQIQYKDFYEEMRIAEVQFIKK